MKPLYIGLVLPVLAACNSGTVPLSVNAAASSDGASCTTSADSAGNLTVSCDNGMIVRAPASVAALFRGASAPQLGLFDASGLQVGTYLISYTPPLPSSSGLYSVWNAQTQKVESYIYDSAAIYEVEPGAVLTQVNYALPMTVRAL